MALIAIKKRIMTERSEGKVLASDPMDYNSVDIAKYHAKNFHLKKSKFSKLKFDCFVNFF
jgi:hypothetical protein